MTPAAAIADITAVFILPADVVVTAIAALPPAERLRLAADADDFVITRVHGRTASKVVDAAIAKLLERFRSGSTIVEAVLAFADENAVDPEAALEGAYPILGRLIHAKFLVEQDSAEAAAFRASQQSGDDCDGLTIVEGVQALEDSELYRARTADGQLVALKLARAETGGQLAAALFREAGILRHLDGSIAPRLVQSGLWEGRPYLATAWCEGVRGDQAALRLRALSGPASRHRLLELCRTIVAAYVSLHRQEVIHGDVHPGNLLVENESSVRIIDFGYSRLVSSADERLSRARRVGVGYFFEPEYARARAEDQAEPPATSYLGEQHILAHLLYWLLTGHGFAEFSADQQLGMAQLVDREPLPFAHWGIEPWPDLERVLARALAVAPDQRFAALPDFAAALGAVQVATPFSHAPLGAAPVALRATDEQPSQTVRVEAPPSDLLDDYLRRFDPTAALFTGTLPENPRCSIYFGGGGIAYFLYRLACLRQDARLLIWAKLWIEKTVADVATAGGHAFYIPDGTISADVLGPISPYHTMSGLRTVQALIAKAQGDITGQVEAVTGFEAATQAPWAGLDLTLGRAGVLLSCALLCEALPSEPRLLTLGDATLADIWASIEHKNEIAHDATIGFTGIAHGWAGILYAALSWCRAAGRPVPGTLIQRLQQLADLAEPHGRGVRWRRIVQAKDVKKAGDYWPSWCNGTSGMIFLWTLAHELLGDPRYLDLAERAALHVVDQPERVDQICCGRPGQAYGILNLYKHTGKTLWLEAAQQMVDQSLTRTLLIRQGEPLPSFHYSLFKGPMGLALLAADLAADPRRTAMPFFESEGWTAGTSAKR